MKKLAPMLLLALTACANTPSDIRPLSPEHREVVVFEVGGDYSFASYDDNFQNGIQYQPGQTRVELKGDNVPQSPKPLYTWANSGEGRDTQAWCRITVDGEVKAEQHTEGDANDPTCVVS
ncbi:Uncharacterised protein [Mycobacteroides abscessus subsp. abscessus]|uniref:hypothetical protein n=1 Tax=Mycobacteroides abscessus TaxID=36809 RepID=UPI000928448E|nr:hypothetical protein [Mycobacteroides abscessus]SIJ97413.1 Uncharacterised protein [Mycobacteroides abscessus subsp. abscessus]